LRKSYTRRVTIRLIGIHLSNFIGYVEQGELFPKVEEKQSRILRTIDRLNAKYGEDIVRFGVA
jgi:hypothetical protein